MASVQNFTLYFEARGDDANLPAEFWQDAINKSSGNIRFFSDEACENELARYINDFNVPEKKLFAYIRIPEVQDNSNPDFYIKISYKAIPISKNAFIKTNGVKFFYTDFTDGGASSPSTIIKNETSGCSVNTAGLSLVNYADGKANSFARAIGANKYYKVYYDKFIQSGLQGFTNSLIFRINDYNSNSRNINILYTPDFAQGGTTKQKAHIYLNQTTSEMMFSFNNQLVNTGLYLTGNDWHLCSLVFDRPANKLKLYFDGFELASLPINFNLTNIKGHDFCIGETANVTTLSIDYDSYLLKLEASSDDDISAYWNNFKYKLDVQSYDEKITE